MVFRAKQRPFSSAVTDMNRKDRPGGVLSFANASASSRRAAVPEALSRAPVIHLVALKLFVLAYSA